MARIIARALVLGLLSLVLVGCSALRLAYNQAPSLGYWWIDGYADLNDAQTSVLRRDIEVTRRRLSPTRTETRVVETDLFLRIDRG